jgi:hypothetical protein
MKTPSWRGVPDTTLCDKVCQEKTTDLPQDTLSHNVVSSTPRHQRDSSSQLSGDRH